MLPDDISEQVRSVEREIASLTDNVQGLSQPPNVTVKRPFDIHSLQVLNEFIEKLRLLAEQLESPEITYTSVGEFPSGAVYLAVRHTDDLDALHQDLITLCANFDILPDEFEADKMIFHTSLALGLNSHQQKTAHRIASGSVLVNRTTRGTCLAILQLTEANEWVVMSTVPFA